MIQLGKRVCGFLFSQEQEASKEPQATPKRVNLVSAERHLCTTSEMPWTLQSQKGPPHLPPTHELPPEEERQTPPRQQYAVSSTTIEMQAGTQGV